MGIFTRKKAALMDLSVLKADMHSHLLPGLDDGSPDMETTLRLISGLRKLGFKKLITTPHIFWDFYKNTPDIIQKKLGEVQEALLKTGLDVELSAAAEYFLDEHLAELLSQRAKLLSFSGNKVLVEFSTMHVSLAMREMLFEMQLAGYQPVLAHPERYIYLNSAREVFHELKENGCMLQLNILSLTGTYGKTVHDLANYLIEKDLYSFMGTDLHHQGHLERLKRITVTPELETLLSSGSLLNNTL